MLFMCPPAKISSRKAGQEQQRNVRQSCHFSGEDAFKPSLPKLPRGRRLSGLFDATPDVLLKTWRQRFAYFPLPKEFLQRFVFWSIHTCGKDWTARRPSNLLDLFAASSARCAAGRPGRAAGGRTARGARSAAGSLRTTTGGFWGSARLHAGSRIS